MTELSPALVVAFVRSVAVLSLDARGQTARLEQLGVLPSADELVLEFDDGFRLVPTFVELGWLKEAAQPALVRLDAQLAAMSGEPNRGLWDAGALADSVEWERVRAYGQAALRQMG